jgi:hypothetical protein
MIKVMQTLFGPTEGNCFPACLASILELDLVEIPNFFYLYPDVDKANEEISAWLLERNLFGPSVSFTSKEVFDRYMDNAPYSIVCGKSPRFDCNHSVVFYRNIMVHDPHPDGIGLENIQGAMFLIPRAAL